jgi:hypothetical protein
MGGTRGDILVVPRQKGEVGLNIDIPGVKAMQQSARFFRDGEADFIEISFVGSKDTTINKVKPEHMAKFRPEWDSYCDGTPMKPRTGTPLTDLPGVDEQRAQQYVSRNVHTAEEIAALSDAQCQALGHGTLTLRKAAQEMIQLRAMKEQERSRDLVTKAAATIGAVPAEKYASASDLAEIKTQIADLSQNVAALVAALSARKPGRPKKVEE